MPLTAIQRTLEELPKRALQPDGQEESQNQNEDTSLPSFVPFTRLEALFVRDLGKDHLREILDELFDEDEPKPSVSKVLHDEFGYLRIFATLLLTGQGKLLAKFHRHGIHDKNLLPQAENIRDFFPTKKEFNTFWDAHWQFFAHSFVWDDDDRKLAGELILPLVFKDEIASGGSSIIYKIKIHPHYDQLEKKPQNHTVAREFALKSYFGDDAATYYKREVDMYRRLRESKSKKNVLNYYYSFVQNGEYHIILEYCNQGNLLKYFKRVDPPPTLDHSLMFWENFLKLAEALHCIHNVSNDDASPGRQIAAAHFDINPKNILVHVPIEERHYFGHHFRIGDLALSRTKEGDEDAVISMPDAHGTKSYGAPEAYRYTEDMEESEMKVTNTADVWSLVCVFLIGVSWSLSGYDEILAFAQEREAGTKAEDVPKLGEAFHNGRRVLHAVRDKVTQYRTLCESAPNVHGVTTMVIDLVEKILKQDPGKRYNSHDVAVEVQSILTKARRLSKTYRRTDPKEPPRHSASEVDLEEVSNHILKPRRQTIASPFIIRYEPQKMQSSPKASPLAIRKEKSQPLPEKDENVIGDIVPEPLQEEPEQLEQLEQTPNEPSSDTSGLLMKNSSSVSEKVEDSPPLKERVGSRQPSVVPLHLTVKEGMEWLREQKIKQKSNKWRVTWWKRKHLRSRNEYPPGSDGAIGRLKNRDHVFVLDDSNAMRSHWDDVCSLLHLLSYIVKTPDIDKDGLDLYIANEPTEPIHSRHSTLLVKKAQAAQPSKERTTNLFHCLVHLLQMCQEEKQTGKEWNIYIFTDGLWPADGPAGGIDEPILKLLTYFEASIDCPVRLQFIQFGRDDAGTKRLQYLDNLKVPGVEKSRDIIDHTQYHAEANVWKILIGALDPAIDKEGESVGGIES